MIELKDITKKYGKKVIFQNFNLKADCKIKLNTLEK